MEGFVSPSHKYTDFFQPEELTDYIQWKIKRKQLVKMMGSKFLSVTEQELISWYSNWEHDALELSKSTSQNSLLSSFLIISILHYYRRDIQFIENFFYIIAQNLQSTQIDVSLTAAAVIKYFTKEGSDITLYLKQLVKSADSIFQKHTVQSYFNALLILHSVAKYVTEDVFQVTTKIIPELLTCVFSSDELIRNKAVQVFYTHVKSLPNECSSFIEGIVFDCRKAIANPDESYVLGSILLIKSLYPIASFYIQPPAIILQILNYFKSFSPELSIAAINLIEFFGKVAPNCLPMTLQQSSLTMVMGKCHQYTENGQLLISFANLLKVFQPECIPIFDILAMISMHIEMHGDVGFMVLNNLLKMFPNQQLSDVIFSVVQPDLNYLKVLKKQKCFIPSFKNKLLETFYTGIKKDVFKDEIIALKILQKFMPSIFDNPITPFEAIRPIFDSESEEVRLELVKTLRHLNIHDANHALLRMAVFDPSKDVRLSAIHQLYKCKENIQVDMIQLLLADTSYKVRRTAISLIWTFAKQNPLRPIPFISNYLKQMLISETSPSNSSRSAKACSLLPKVAKYLIDDTPSFIPYLTWICVALLCGDDPFPDFPENVGSQFNDLRKVFNQDFIADDFTLNYSPKDPNLYHVFQIENSKYSSNRAKYLFDTLRTLSPYLYRFIYQVIPVFASTFRVPQTDIVLIAALKALISIVSICDQSINFADLSPGLLPSLFKLLGDNCSEEVAVYILKAAGTMGASFSGFYKINDELFDPSNLNDSVFKYLCRSEMTPRLLEILAIIITQESEAGIPYLDQIIPPLISTIENSNATNLFQALELIVWKCNFYIQPYLDIIEPLLINFISNLSCLYLCVQLSYQLKTVFTPIASHIFPIILNNLQELDPPYIQPAYKLIAFIITFQRQNFDIFLNNVYQRVSNGWKPPTQLLLCILRILKFNSFSFFCARIMQLCLKLLPYKHLSDLILQIIYFLVLYNNVPAEFIDSAFIKKYSTKLAQLKNVINYQPYIRGKVSFLKDINLKPRYDRLTKFINEKLNMMTKKENVTKKASNYAFSSVSDPTFNNSSKWLYELTTPIFSCSPLPAIRSCTQLVLHSHQLRTDLFPIAFLSCWRVASKAEKKNISNMISNIFSQFSSIDPLLLILAETLDRAGCPLMIPNDLIASKCTSPALRVYFLNNHLYNSPISKNTIDSLLTVNSTMGRLDCARGLLSRVSPNMTQKDSGKWFEQLGEWVKALAIYEKEPDSIERSTALIRCYGHLEHWETIRNMVPIFEQMNINERYDTALWFAWAFYHVGDFEQVKHYEKFFSPNDPKQLIFTVLYLISSDQLDLAGPCIENGFKILVKDRGVFNGSDTGLATKLLVSAQHLIELKEALKTKKHISNVVPKMWKNRLEGFRHGSDAWMKLIEIRSLLLSPAEHIDACLKMISTLRKERKWRLIDGYFNRLFSSINSPKVILADVKIKWARGQQCEAISLISCFNRHIDGESTEMDSLFEGIGEPDTKLRARLLRIQGNMQYQICGSENLESVKECFKRSLKLNDLDYRSWAGLAYVSSRMINYFDDKSSLAYDVVTSFLKATQIHPESSLEFLCQLFSIFSQYGNNLEIENLTKEITSLPVHTIAQVVPQLVGHIAHPSEKVRNVVKSILECYGISHFETVFYSLNFSCLSGDKNKSSISNEIMFKIKLPHIHTHADALLFVDGMRMAAINWFEQWISTIGVAIKFIKNNDFQSLKKLLDDQFEEVKHPRCEFDALFAKTFHQTIQDCKTLFDKHDPNLPYALINFQKELDGQLRKIDQIQLNKISVDLAEKRHFHLSVPGQFEENEPPKIFMIDPNFTVLRTQQHPRSVFIIDENGKKWRFLLKGKEDLRLDQRIMQLFRLINTLLTNDRLTSSLEIKIEQYPIIPFAKDCGLIGWVGGADTLQHLVTELRSMKNIPQLLEINILHEMIGPTSGTQTYFQRRETFEQIVSQAPATELRDIIWLKSPNPEAWLQRVDNFTKSTGLMSITGYVIGLGDRHPSNMMIQRDTGRVIHIDFGDSFESAMRRTSFPERVPFRLTRMIVNAFDCGGIDGLFRRTCEDAMNVLREHKTSIAAQLEIFVHEPIFSGFANQSAKSLLDRISKKLMGQDPLPEGENQVELDVSKQVDSLINIAKDPNNYMQHYLGWCPFW
ncbi:PIKK family atypical protein kinase [Tritrichomonas foetus]|uniref:PIKK family atypical protein kinase n=1 Tax=Tritrichomonas foetus TaxID=1144522 RepID=A0A1J4JQD4_9EUKA|nr:PIKK family atypical protein kinase [Tritrichomonas foetus]|eukprot:OHT01329.1 PIKK family atypical protein kinase [Tritrichomonas foetus]